MKLILLQVLQQAVMLLRGNSPAFEAGAPRHVLVLSDRRLVQVGVALETEPSMAFERRFFVDWPREFRGEIRIWVRFCVPKRVVGRPPFDGFWKTSFTRWLELRKIGVNGTHVVMDPSHQRTVYNVGGDHEVFWVVELHIDNAWDGVVVNPDLTMLKSALRSLYSTRPF